MMVNNMVLILAVNFQHAKRHAHDCGIPFGRWQKVSRVDHLRAAHNTTIVVLPGYTLPVHVGEYREMEHYLRLVASGNKVYRWPE